MFRVINNNLIFKSIYDNLNLEDLLGLWSISEFQYSVIDYFKHNKQLNWQNISKYQMLPENLCMNFKINYIGKYQSRNFC